MNVVLSVVPIEESAVIVAMVISITKSAYSTAVAPEQSVRNLFNRLYVAAGSSYQPHANLMRL